MSSLVQGSQQTPNSQFPLGMNVVRSVESGAVYLFGSFEGNGASSPVSLQTRGNWFTPTLLSTGVYQVQLNLNVLATYSSLTNATQASLGSGPGWPAGLLEEPIAWLTNETPGTAPALAGTSGIVNYVQVQTTKLDKVNAATLNTFQIRVASCSFATIQSAGPVLTNVSSSDRLNFRLAFKLIGFTP